MVGLISLYDENNFFLGGDLGAVGVNVSIPSPSINMTKLRHRNYLSLNPNLTLFDGGHNNFTYVIHFTILNDKHEYLD